MVGLRGLISILLALHLSAGAGNGLVISGGRPAGLGNAVVGLVDFWAVRNNQAAMAEWKSISAGVYYENRFLMNELSVKAAALVIPSRLGSFGLSFSNFGFSLYNETIAGLGYARRFGRYLSVGVQLDYLRTHIGEGYGNRNLITFEVGLLAHPGRKMTIGVHVYSPYPVKMVRGGKETIPTTIRMGGVYQCSSKILITVEAEKELKEKARLKAGLEFHAAKPLSLQVGASSSPGMIFFGVGLHLSRLDFHLASSYHPVLGYSPQASLVFQISRKN